MFHSRASVVAVVALAGLGLCASAHASVYTYHYSQSGVGAPAAQNTGGYVDSIDAQFDSSSKRLSFSAAFGPATGQTWLGTHGFWMVMSDGPMPRDTASKYGVFYFDGSVPATPRLTVYTYNGSGTPMSYLGGDLIRSAWDGSYINSIADQDKTISSGYRRVMSFDIDATSIISHTPAPAGSGAWVGAGFGQSLGLWIYPVLGFSATYNAQGGIGTIAYSDPGWLGLSNIVTQGGTPAPGAAALLGLGGAFAARRRRAA